MDWGALVSTLSLVFVAELGDKTQLAVVTQTCKHRRPWPVFLGASLALTLVSLLGALGGQLIGRLISPVVLRIAAAVAFVVMGALIAREAVRAYRVLSEDDACPYVPPGEACQTGAGWSWPAFNSTLGLLFVAELGDKTQLGVFSLSSKHSSPWAVFVGGSLALTLVTALGVIGGQGLCKIIPERVLLAISAAAFMIMGILIGFGIL
ncbi:MAG TPA: TMEM165/GDT1 family protein [Anaerolineae bacterium]|nr:TMEM165/GDT1 family protein [Anaerolineae bacterium]